MQFESSTYNQLLRIQAEIFRRHSEAANLIRQTDPLTEVEVET